MSGLLIDSRQSSNVKEVVLISHSIPFSLKIILKYSPIDLINSVNTIIIFLYLTILDFFIIILGSKLLL